MNIEFKLQKIIQIIICLFIILFSTAFIVVCSDFGSLHHSSMLQLILIPNIILLLLIFFLIINNKKTKKTLFISISLTIIYGLCGFLIVFLSYYYNYIDTACIRDGLLEMYFLLSGCIIFFQYSFFNLD